MSEQVSIAASVQTLSESAKQALLSDMVGAERAAAMLVIDTAAALIQVLLVSLHRIADALERGNAVQLGGGPKE